MSELQFHEAANIYPLMKGKAFDALIEDIRKNGIRIPIKLIDGKVGDGRNRVRACKIVGIEPPTENAPPEASEDPIAYVRSCNEYRMHYTKSQHAMAAAKARKYHDKQAKERQLATLKHGDDTPVPAKVPERSKGDARDQVGKAFGVSGKYVDLATDVLKEAHPDLTEAVSEGRVALRTAVEKLHEPQEAQGEFARAAKIDYSGIKKRHQEKQGPRKSLTPKQFEKLEKCADDLWRLVTQPSMCVSLANVQLKIKELQEIIQHLKE